MLWVGLAYSSMPPLADWQTRLAVGLQHYGQVITNALAWVPNWAGAVVFLMLVGGLAWYALRQVGASSEDNSDDDKDAKDAAEAQEEVVDKQEEPVEY